MKVAVVDYNAGNVGSVRYALERLGIQPVLTAEKDVLLSADKIIFPGVGEAKTTMEYLKSEGLDKLIIDLKQPVLGICLGMQLMCRHSEEGDTNCLGIFDIPVLRFCSEDNRQKIPHTGWNTVEYVDSPLYKGLKVSDFVYFVHSYYVPLCKYTASETDYISRFSSSLQKDNFFAVQFHPEKSGTNGELILNNFLNL